MARHAVSKTNRRAVRGGAAAALATACLAALVTAVPAEASVTVGQLAPTPPDSPCPTAGYDYLQTSVTSGNLYSARQAGTITSWSTISSGPGATYVFKVLRRTSDPDAFQVAGRAAEHTLTAGLNTFPAGIQVESGDLIGVHAQGGIAGNSCTFPVPGDGVLRSPSDLDPGQPPAQFTPVPDVRLNLSAVLVPSNAFTITSITPHRRGGTATLAVDLSNPGLAAVGGTGVKTRHVTTAVASQVSLKVATTGKRLRRLSRTGRLKLPVAVSFYPTGGDPSSQTVSVKLRMKRARPPV